MKNHSTIAFLPVPIKAAAIVLFLLGALKLFSWFAQQDFGHEPDAVLGVRVRDVMLVMGVIEVSSAIWILLFAPPRAAAWLVLALGTAFVAYRILLTSLGGTACPCLGAIRSWIPFITISTEQHLLVAIAAWLVLSGLWSLVICLEGV